MTGAATAQPLRSFDRAMFEPQIRAIARDPELHYARMFDDQGVVLYVTGDQSAISA